jgi:hypothetical protein
LESVTKSYCFLKINRELKPGALGATELSVAVLEC